MPSQPDSLPRYHRRDFGFRTRPRSGRAARLADVVLCPGIGFDVIPTDCLALALKEALPDATDIVLGFEASAGPSPGTAKTALDGIGRGGVIRRDGQLVAVPLGHAPRRIDFGDGAKTATAIPWGDVATAYFSTGIRNIAVYIPTPKRVIVVARATQRFSWVLRAKPMQRALTALAEKYVKGPDAETRERGKTYVWGEVRNARGEVRTARITTANGYSVTMHGSLAVIQHLLENAVPGGFYTPSRLVGPRLVESLPGSGVLVIS